MCSVIVCQLFVVLWLWTVAAIGPTGMGVFRGVLQVQPSNEFFTVKNRTKFYANAPHSKPLFCFLSTPLPTAGLFPAPAQRLMDPMNWEFGKLEGEIGSGKLEVGNWEFENLWHQQ